MKISWIDIPDRIKYELRQREEQGSNVANLENEWRGIEEGPFSREEFRAKAAEFYQKIDGSTTQGIAGIDEPATWEAIARYCDIEPDQVPVLSASLVEDRILGGWLGRSAGCLLGKPVEKISRPGMIELLSSNGSWPITEYITAKGISENLLQRYPWNKHSGKESLRESIECMTDDDDMNYPMLNLSVFEKFGAAFDSNNIIEAWMSKLPVLSTFTAERVAYVNALADVPIPQTAMLRNPYREWIGAQIRADLWGWVSPAQPARAAEFAWRDARLSHVENGMYAEMFFAAAVASAFDCTRSEDVIENALQYIPSKSRLADAIRFVLSMPVSTRTWDETVAVLYDKFGHYHWVHAINNAALVVAALLSSEGNYERAICNVVMGGWDTDSNGATVGSIMGTMLGASALPKKWIAPLRNKIRSSLQGYDNALLSTLAKRTTTVALFQTG